MTTVRDALIGARRQIEALGSDEAALEAELLMMHVLGVDRAHLYERLQDALDPETATRFDERVQRRLAHEPVAYITGHREFFGLEFEVSPDVLIPRPETELLVEQALDFAHERAGLTIADIGTGSGAIAIAIAHELRSAHVIATDISGEALELARRNASRLGVAIDLRQGDLMTPIDAPVDLVVTNLPYVTTAQWQAMPPEIRDYEPRTALDGGADGLDVIWRLLQQAPAYLNRGGALFCEIGDWQGDAASALARAAFPEARIEVQPDLAGRDRVLCVYL